MNIVIETILCHVFANSISCFINKFFWFILEYIILMSIYLFSRLTWIQSSSICLQNIKYWQYMTVRSAINITFQLIIIFGSNNHNFHDFFSTFELSVRYEVFIFGNNWIWLGNIFTGHYLIFRFYKFKKYCISRTHFLYSYAKPNLSNKNLYLRSPDLLSVKIS